MGIVADNPDLPIDLKAFHCKVVNDKAALDAEKAAYLSVPKIRKVTEQDILQNYEQIKQDVQDIVDSVLEAVFNDPAKQHLLTKGK